MKEYKYKGTHLEFKINGEKYHLITEELFYSEMLKNYYEGESDGDKKQKSELANYREDLERQNEKIYKLMVNLSCKSHFIFRLKDILNDISQKITYLKEDNKILRRDLYRGKVEQNKNRIKDITKRLKKMKSNIEYVMSLEDEEYK